MNDLMLDEIIKEIQGENDYRGENKEYNTDIIVDEKVKDINENFTLTDILLGLVSEKRLNILLKRKVSFLETVVKKKKEEKEVKNYFIQHFSKDIYLKNQVIYSSFHQGPPITTDMNKKTKGTRNNKKCK
jgi:hypothetical protein